MAFTAQLGIATSRPGNIELGFGAGITPQIVYSGIYQLVPGQSNDVLYSLISYPEFQTATLKIPDPYVELAYVTDTGK